jgi:hypothetical protein
MLNRCIDMMVEKCASASRARSCRQRYYWPLYAPKRSRRLVEFASVIGGAPAALALRCRGPFVTLGVHDKS